MSTRKDDMIFVVEDDKMYSKMFEYKLKESGNSNIKTFATGEECLENMHLNPSVVVLDYQLPSISGLETLKHIKESNPETAVVALSNNNDLSVKRKFFDEGVYEYFQKSKDTYDKICNTVDYLLWIVKSKKEQQGKVQSAVSLMVILILIGIVLIHLIITKS